MRNQFLTLSVLIPAVFALAACGDEPAQQSDAAPKRMEEAAPQVMEKPRPRDTEALIAGAVADAARPTEDSASDMGRKPADIMAFAGFKPGDVVADIGASGGYYTRIVSKIVGGKGHVYAFNSTEIRDMFFKDGNPSDALAVQYENVSSVVTPLSTPFFEKPLDGAMIVKFYHDTHWDKLATDTGSMNKTIFDQLKPGGTYLVIDHAAEDGSGLRDAGTLHRIDAEVVKQEVIAAGFELVAESDLLANSEDDRSKSVFDPSVRGKTHRFVYKFKKPE
jgi:predicted methyltransferase